MTARNGSVRSPLTDLEHDIMTAVWTAGPATVEAVYLIVGSKRRLKEVTVRTLLRRLESKGYLRHESDGRAYVYHATEPPGSLAARAVRQIIDRFCQGSVEQLVTGMVDAEVLSARELKRLSALIDAHRKARKKC